MPHKFDTVGWFSVGYSDDHRLFINHDDSDEEVILKLPSAYKMKDLHLLIGEFLREDD